MKKLKYLAALFFCFLLYLGYLQISGNFHEIIPGDFYRSAQLSEGDITKYKDKYGIKSVINLRGENLKQDWYKNEIAEAEAAGVTHINFKMSAKKDLTPNEAIRLMKVMAEAPKPMLIHCRGGSDRTGLAAALYLAGVKKWDEELAEEQLSIRYGHISLFFNGPYAMNNTFESLEPYLGFLDS